MPFRVHFRLADELVKHLKALAVTENDPQVLAIYSGFVAVSAVTVYELAFRTVFIGFATPRDSAFGSSMEARLKKINGRIAISDIQDEFLKRFGGKYSTRFTRLLDRVESLVLKKQGQSVRSSYADILTWRHEFAHQGRPPATVTFAEACQSYESGKVVLHCLSRILR